MELLRIQFQSRRYKALFLFWLMFSLQTSIVTVTVQGKKTEKDAGHNPKNNNLTSRSILRQLSQFPQHTWKHGDGPLWVNYFISCTGVLDSHGFYFMFLCNMPSSVSTFFIYFFWVVVVGGAILVKLLLFTLMNDWRWWQLIPPWKMKSALFEVDFCTTMACDIINSLQSHL